jgi:outer membrane protein OmpA-like peptidoglycan-associated protein
MKWIGAIAVAWASILVSGCGSVSKGVADDGRSAEELVFPDPDSAVLKSGTFPDVADLRNVAPGMTRDQLYQMFGRPHFHEGAWNVREWDYLFNFRTGDDGQFVTCEFKVLFDRDQTAQSFYWKPENCADLVRPKPVADMPEPAPAPMPAQPIRLSTDTLFAFDSWHLSDAGKYALDALLVKIQSASRLEDIRVVGYTDRIGTDAYNMNLSLRRAEAVRDYLTDHGVPADAIITGGRGNADPLVPCNGVPAGQLIACLAPNRRVELSGRARP